MSKFKQLKGSTREEKEAIPIVTHLGKRFVLIWEEEAFHLVNHRGTHKVLPLLTWMPVVPGVNNVEDDEETPGRFITEGRREDVIVLDKEQPEYCIPVEVNMKYSPSAKPVKSTSYHMIGTGLSKRGKRFRISFDTDIYFDYIVKVTDEHPNLFLPESEDIDEMIYKVETKLNSFRKDRTKDIKVYTAQLKELKKIQKNLQE